MADDINPDYGYFEGTPGNNPPSEPLVRDTVKSYLDYAFKEFGGPGYQSPMVNLLRGIRVLGPGNQMAPLPDDTIGLVFMTRPMLNLSDENVKEHEQLVTLYRPQKNTPSAYLKGLLDPNWGRGNSGGIEMLDPLCPWIPPVTNLVKVSSGFPDLQISVGKSSPGLRGEVYRRVNSILQVNYDYDIRQSYFPSKPNILPAMYEIWSHYIDAVTLGDQGCEPYPEALIENFIDYDCRIYHLVLNKDQRSIEGIYCCASAFPTTFPSGAYSTVDRTQNTLRGQGQDELEITFSSVGFRFGNIRVMDMFNRTTLKFNPGMLPSVREQKYRKLSMGEYFMGGYNQIYPWININEMVLEYWSPI